MCIRDRVEARGKKKGRDARRARQSEEAFKRHNLKEELAEACLLYTSFQLNRVASTRGVPPEKIRKLVSEHFVRGGSLGENVVNVMTLNAALDTLFPMSGM